MIVICPDCGTKEILSLNHWRCRCGGAWEPSEQKDFDTALIESDKMSIWRYRGLFGLDSETQAVSLGEGGTPLLVLSLDGRDIHVKLEYLAPTSSFKDRGTSVMISVLVHQGAKRIADDSSGNAGASVAAYSARAGMEAEIFVPAHASLAKQGQISVYGANVNPVPGPRENAKLAALEAVDRRGLVFASHQYHPGFVLGQQTVAWEVWEQLGYKAPGWYIAPVGGGMHLLAAWLGFRRLKAAGLIDRLPRMVAVQARLLAPLCEAYAAGLETVPGVESGVPSVAEGLAITKPVRGRRLLKAVRESRGTCLAVEEEDILAARRLLARRGLFVEPSSATAIAALPQLYQIADPEDVIVVPLTGSGLKGSPTID